MQKLNCLTNVFKKKVYYCLTATVVVICIIGGVLWKENIQVKSATEDVPLVRTATINVAEPVQSYTYSGEVRGRYESQLAFQVNGKIIKRNVELGSTVKPGDVLMQIDPKDLQQTVNSSSAQVYSAESQLKLAESNLNRYQQLYAQQAISRAQLDQYQNAYDVAVAAVRQTAAQYAQGANQLDYSLLYADKTGVISSISAEVGQVVGAGQTVLTIVQDGEREVEINVPENRIEELRKKAQLKVTFWALPGVVIDGKIREMAPMADSTTRTFKVRISLVNPPTEIKLGMTAAVQVADSGGSGKVVTIPLSSIYQDDDSPHVWVVADHVVHLRPIEIGSFGNAQVQVIAGLRAGETIVIAGVHKLREGQTVKITGGDTP